MNVNYEKLNAALKMLKKATTKGNLPCTGYVKLHPSEWGFWIVTNNLDFALYTHMDGARNFNIPVCVDFKALFDAISNKKCDEVYLEINADQTHLLVTQKTRTVKLEIKQDEFPETPPVTDLEHQIGFALTKAQWAEIQKSVIPFAATDDTRPVLAGVLFEFGEDGLHLAAADGFQLGTYYAPFGQQNGVNYVVPAKALKVIPSNVALDVVAYGDGRAAFGFRDGKNLYRLISRTIDGHFPDFRQIIPDDVEVTLKVHTDVIHEASKLPLDNGMLKFFDTRAEGSIVDQGVYEWNGHSVRLTGGESAAFNSKLLKNFIHLADKSDDMLTMSAYSSKHAWRATKGNSTAVLMPMVIGDK